jgi:hypothetical protein
VYHIYQINQHVHNQQPYPCQPCTCHITMICLNLPCICKEMHQPCTKTMYQHKCINYAQHNLSQQLCLSTYLINLINQIRSIHQDQSPRQLSTICTISPRCASTKTTHKHQQDVPQSRCASKSIPYIYATSSINHVPTILLASASNNVPSMYQSCINYRSSYDSSRCTNITIPYTSCMCQLINYMSQYVTQPYAKYIHQDIQQIGL